MLFERAFTFLSLYATRRLSRQRAVTILAIYAIVVCSVVLVSYFISFSLVLYPLAHVLFDLSGGVASGGVPRAWNDPEGIATFAMGAYPANRTAELRARRQYVNYDALPMRRPEADLIMSYLNPTDTYLEYGASGTTLAFPMLVRHSFAIEHDTEVCDGISSEMQKHRELADRLRAFCAPVPPGRADWALQSQFEEGSYRAFHNYVDFPRTNLSSVKFDKVLINGRARVACALRILPQLHAQSIVFFHDYFLRPKHYSYVLAFFDEVARIVAHGPVTGFTDEPMGLLVLKPKPQYVEDGLSDISVARVNAIYDTFHDIAPTEKSASLETAFQSSLLSTGEGEFPYYDMKRKLTRETTRARLLLDLVMIPFIALTYYILRIIFLKIFLEALTCSGTRSSRIFAGDLRAAIPWASRGSSSMNKPLSKTIPISVSKTQENSSSLTGKAE